MVRLVGTILATTLALIIALEISIPGGQRAVIFPNGMPAKGQRSERAQRIIDAYNLDDPVFVRWLKWIGDVLQGDFGVSRDRGGTPVLELMAPRLSISLQIMLVATALAVLIGIPLGIYAAARDGRVTGTLADAVAGIFQSIPVFITPVFLVWLFALKLRWLPAAGWVRISDSLTGNLKAMILPVISLALAEIGYVARVIRSGISETMRTDYVAAAVGKGLSSSYVLFRHALRPASLGLLNVIGLNVGALLSGSFVIEIIFGIGAFGNLFLGALLQRDLYLLLGLTVYVVTVYVVLNALVDGLMLAADPRIRRS